MKSYIRIIGILLFSVFITIFISPIIASLLPFHLYKIMSRTVLIVTFLLFYYYRGFKGLGFEFNRRWWVLLILGLALGLFSIGIISAMMLYTSIRFIVSDVLWIRHLFAYLFTGLIVALVEECFFRGFILQALLKDTGMLASLFITNILYSVVHFLKPDVLGETGVLNLFSSIRAIPLFFAPLFIKLPEIWPSIIGLFLVGVVLSMAYIRVRTLAMSIGLHAGWVMGIKTLSRGTDAATTGGGDVITHPFTWSILLIFILLFYVTRRAVRPNIS